MTNPLIAALKKLTPSDNVFKTATEQVSRRELRPLTTQDLLRVGGGAPPKNNW